MDAPALSELIPVVAIVGVAATIFMIAGFGFALFAVPAISLFMPVTESVALISLLGLASVSRQSLALRAHVEPTSAKKFSIAAVAGMPLGLWIVTVISDQALRIALGVSTVMATAVLLRQTEDHKARPLLDTGLAFLSGVLNTSIGTNGPPLVFALQGRRLAPDQFRGTIAVIFAVSGVVTTSMFAVNGRYSMRLVLLACFALPTWFIGTLIGRNVATRINRDQFRMVVLCLLAVTGLSTLISAL